MCLFSGKNISRCSYNLGTQFLYLNHEKKHNTYNKDLVGNIFPKNDTKSRYPAVSHGISIHFLWNSKYYSYPWDFYNLKM